MIWVVLFLALAVVSFTLSMRSHVREASVAASAAEASALADAASQLALHDLVNAQWSRAWQRRFPPDGRAYGCSIGSGRVVVTVEDEAGKIDLNTATEALLRALLIGVGRPASEADRLTAAILDYRDADNVRRPDGAEASDYKQAGRRNGPKNAQFDSILELAQVLGVDADLLANVRRFVTIHSGLAGIDPSKASPELAAALAAGARFVQPPPGAPGGEVRPSSFPALLSAISPQRFFLIRAQATGERGARYTRETIVHVSPSRSRPYAVLSWRRGSSGSEGLGVDLGIC